MVDPNEPALRRSVRGALILAGVAVTAFGAVTLVHESTRDRIAAAANAQRMTRFADVLQNHAFDNDIFADVLQVTDPELLGTSEPVPAYRARLRGRLVAVVLEPVAPNGYGGPIRLRVAIAPDATVLGVRVLQHRETAGLGDAIEASRSGWIDRFTGKSLASPPPSRWHVRKDGGDFDQFTGATVTPRAVVSAVANALLYFERHRAELTAPPGTMAVP